MAIAWPRLRQHGGAGVASAGVTCGGRIVHAAIRPGRVGCLDEVFVESLNKGNVMFERFLQWVERWIGCVIVWFEEKAKTPGQKVEVYPARERGKYHVVRTYVPGTPEHEQYQRDMEARFERSRRYRALMTEEQRAASDAKLARVLERAREEAKRYKGRWWQRF